MHGAGMAAGWDRRKGGWVRVKSLEKPIWERLGGGADELGGGKSRHWWR